MKHICFAFLLAALLSGCGNTGNKTGASIAAGSSAHLHADGTPCSGDHSHDSQATPHQHAPGESCDHDHGDAQHASHSHADGSVCSGDHSHTGSHEGHNHAPGESCGGGHDHDPDEIIFPASQAARTDFEVQTAALSDFAQVIKTSGRIMPAQGDDASVVAPTSGVLSYSGSRLSDGVQVSLGQGLFYISSRNIGQGDVVSRTSSAYRKAKADFDRAEKLLADRIVSQREYDEALATYEQAKAEYEALSGSSSQRGVGVNAPITGYIGSLAVKEGDYVETGQVLAVVSQNRTLTLRADVSQKYLPRLATISSANFTVPSQNTTYRLSEMDGRLLSVSRNTSGAGTLIPVTFQFNNIASVMPGTYVEVSLLGTILKDQLTLPLTAVTEQQGLYYVYVANGPESYLRREVTLGEDDGLRVRILSGIEPGDRVVTRGAVNVKMASASGSIPHTHEH